VQGFSLSPGPQARGHCFSVGARSGNPPLAASPVRRRGESFLQATTGRAGAAKGTLPFPEKKIPGQGGKNCKPGRIQGKAAAGQNHNPRPRLQPARAL